MTNTLDILFIGGGGHSLACADILLQNKSFNLAGFIDPNKNAPLATNGYKWIGSDEQLIQATAKYKNIFISIGYIKDPSKRIYLFNECKKLGCNFPILKSNFCYVSPTASIEEGTLIMNGTIVNAKSHIKKNCIINNNVVIEHGVSIGNNVHLAPSSTILGDVSIGDQCFIGAGAIIREGVSIQKGTFIKAGEIITSSNDKII